MPKLTKAILSAVRPPASGSETHWDSMIRGFGVRVTANDARSFLVRYKNRSGQVRWLVLGRVGTLTLDEARDEAAKVLGAVAKGEDPAEERSAERKAETIAQLVDLYERGFGCAARHPPGRANEIDNG